MCYALDSYPEATSASSPQQKVRCNMALARCLTCGSPEGLKSTYPHFHTLPSSPVNIKVLCGSRDCARHGFIWLTKQEEQQYLHGQRDFRIPNRALDVHVT
jgi:hypothetical protein